MVFTPGNGSDFRLPRRQSLQWFSLGLLTGTVGSLAVADTVGAEQQDLSASPSRELTKRQEEQLQRAVAEFQETYRVPGLSIAMARQGEMVLARGFGLADKKTEEPVTPQHRFRIASISKAITSLVCFRLWEQKQITLELQPFAEEGPLADLVEADKLTPLQLEHLRCVTVQHLLEHSVGQWGNLQGDPVFDLRAIYSGNDSLIRWVLRMHPLEEPPGETFVYSNFGYFVLGRLLERLSGKSYEELTREQVLKPAGVAEMHVGTSKARAAGDREVRYYGQGDSPYHVIMRLERMGPFGGWVASPLELVRLLLRFDMFPTPADLLRPKTLQLMTQPSARNPRYAKGWNVNDANNWWHLGSFNGASGIWVRTHDGWCWALLVNSRSHAPDFLPDLDELCWTIREILENNP